MAPTSPEITEPIPPEDDAPRSETDALLDRLNGLIKEQAVRPDDGELRQQIEQVKAELRSFATGESITADAIMSDVETSAHSVGQLRRRQALASEGVSEVLKGAETSDQTLKTFEAAAARALGTGFDLLPEERQVEINDLLKDMGELHHQLYDIGKNNPRVMGELENLVEHYNGAFGGILEEEKQDPHTYLFDQRKALYTDMVGQLHDLMSRFQRTRKTES